MKKKKRREEDGKIKISCFIIFTMGLKDFGVPAHLNY